MTLNSVVAVSLHIHRI